MPIGLLCALPVMYHKSPVLTNYQSAVKLIIFVKVIKVYVMSDSGTHSFIIFKQKESRKGIELFGHPIQ